MMKLYPSWFTFLMTNLMGLIIISSSTNWFFMWMGLELSLFGFLPLFLPNKASIEGMTKYLLIQAGGSTLFLFSFLANSSLSPNLMLMSMSVKLGLFPFFQWVPSIMASMNWIGCMILSTIQKLGPMIILMKLQSNYYALLLISSISIMISGLMGMNQNYMRPLLGYSSISHTSWISCSLVMSQFLPMMYILLYFMTTFILMTILHYNNTNKVVSNNKHLSHSNTTNFLMLNLLGMPPFAMFFLKMNVFMLMWQSNYTFILIPMILGSMFSAYFYLTFVIPSMVKNWSLKQNKMTLLVILSIANLPMVMLL